MLEIKDYDGNIKAEVSTNDVARALDVDSMADLLTTFCNYGFKGFRVGEEVGLELRRKHRTLQASAYRFCLGVIVGLSQQEHTDLRNETAVRNAKKIAEMMKNGEIEKGYMI